ncbi:serine/threonine-protein kinase [Amycolatopsis sp. H20-H5]|uniref:serine/threonine-protein kinase n=1 Tax=Amycolatopsis sp. H20-H5 TaxID=3046309 RepID=UPI002DB571E7|nr:serine/threonine-protein kinase [Amycolatopsis sp. H20-H5]MEC3978470.1 serine/threonine-protein kinase [Amycolatopsis sp. H20-H5]
MNDAEARSDTPDDTADTEPRFTLGAYDPDPRPWLVAGRYQVGRLLGEGSTARVYRAHDRHRDRPVALKLFHQGAAAVEERRQAQEIRILRGIRHPGVVALHDADVDHGHAYLAMDLVDGPNLAERLATGPFTLPEVADLATQLATALAHVHALGVTHRDLKPANILLAGHGPLISDFGVARAFGTTRVTEIGAVIGTAAYMAPEQVLGEDAGRAADIYALGLVLLECLTGTREYLGSPVESAVGRLHRPPRVPGGLPPGWARTLRGMTARRAEDRPAAADVALAFQEGGAPVPAARRRPLRPRTLAATGAPGARLPLVGGVRWGAQDDGATNDRLTPAAPESTTASSPTTTPTTPPPAQVTVTSPATEVVTEQVPVTARVPASDKSAPGKSKGPKKTKGGKQNQGGQGPQDD